MIEIKRSHLVAASSIPLAVVLVAVALVAIRGRSPAPPNPVADVLDRTGKVDQTSR